MHVTHTVQQDQSECMHKMVSLNNLLRLSNSINTLSANKPGYITCEWILVNRHF